MTYRGSRRVRLVLNVAAHLAVLGLVFQIMAFDHWQLGFDDVQGIEGSSTHMHASHCHGDVAGCAGSGGAAANLLDAQREFGVPRTAFVQAASPSTTFERPHDASLKSLDPPPRPAA